MATPTDPPSRTALLLPLLGLAVVVLLGVQWWRAQRLDRATRTVELDRARLAADRWLRDALADAALFDRLPAAECVTLRDGAVDVDTDVGWLHANDADTNVDLLGAAQLDEAARVEFGGGDAAAAAAILDELCDAASTLPPTRRAALAAAAWNAHRRGDADARARRHAELEAAIAALPPSAFAGRADAAHAASCARLAAAQSLPIPAFWTTVAPRIRDDVADPYAGVDPAHDARVAAARMRRELLRRVAAIAATLADGPAAGVVVDANGTTWWTQRRDGATRVAVELAPDAFVALARADAATQARAPWPWLLEPRFADAGTRADSAPTSFPLPGLLALDAADGSPFTTGEWLLPALTVVLVVIASAMVRQQFRATARESDAARRQMEFLTTVTHELKTPLASIRLLAEMLVDDRARGKERDYYGLLAVEAARLTMLIENVLDLGRVERGERADDRRDVDLREVVAETVALFAPLAARDGMTVTFDGDGAALPVHVDRGAFVQALLNVLDNARKYAASGRRIVVTAGVDDGVGDDACAAWVRVRDHGPGVASDEREGVFARFVRGRAHRHGGVPGVGIGLYLARTIARRHGGDLTCTAADDGGGGAVFTFVVPLRIVAGSSDAGAGAA